MGWLDGKVAIVTGAARGIGRQHALLLASEGAKVVVNDQGSSVSWDTYDPIDGSDLNGYGGVGPDGMQASGDGAGDAGPGPADAVVAEIQAKGGEAIANGEDVANWDGGKRLIDAALDAFGDLHVLVNNAGILRDRFLVNMTEEEWDSVIQVVLKGHFVPLRHAATYWRERSKEGSPVNASVINTSSTSGLLGNPGQINYGAAKAGIGALTVIAAEELAPLRGQSQRHRPRRPHPPHRSGPRSRRDSGAAGGSRPLRRVGPGKCRPTGGMAGIGRVLSHRSGVLHLRGDDRPDGRLDPVARRLQARSLDDRRDRNRDPVTAVAHQGPCPDGLTGRPEAPDGLTGRPEAPTARR